MSDERQELEDLCVDKEECKAEADTETGEKPCIGCNDFAVAPPRVAPAILEEIRQTEIRNKIADRLELLDTAKIDEASLKDEYKDAKACVETHKKALENLCRSLGTPPEATLWNHPDVEVTFDPVAGEATTEVGDGVDIPEGDGEVDEL